MLVSCYGAKSRHSRRSIHRNSNEGVADIKVSSQLDSLRIWLIFASAYPGKARFKDKHYRIYRIRTSFSNYVNPLISSSLEWITLLTLSHINCSRTDLVKLSRLTNLGVLTIGPDISGSINDSCDDGIVKAWSQAAEESNAFGVLRVLAFRSQPKITVKIFDYLLRFPSLKTLAVVDFSLGDIFEHPTAKGDWEIPTKETLDVHLAQGEVNDKSWDLTVRTLFTCAGMADVKVVPAEKAGVRPSPPLLHLSLRASPRDIKTYAKYIGSIMCFCRRENHDTSLSNLVTSRKRPIGPEAQRRQPNCPKRPMQSFRRQDMGTTLAEFGL